MYEDNINNEDGVKVGLCSELGSGSQNVNGVKEEDKVKNENYVEEGVGVNDKNYYKHVNNVKDENDIKDKEDVKDENDVKEKVDVDVDKMLKTRNKELNKRWESAKASAADQMNPCFKNAEQKFKPILKKFITTFPSFLQFFS